MTISAVVPDIAFAGSSGSGTMGPFSLVKSGTPIIFYANSEVYVYRYDAVTDTAPTLLVEGTDYTLTGGPDAGSITLTSPQTGLLTAERLYVYTRTSITQALDLVNGGNFSSSNLERRLDIIFQIIQQLDREVKSGIRFAMFDTDEIPKTLPLGAAIDKIPYVTGTAASPTVAYLSATILADLSELSVENLANIAIVAADLAGPDTIGIVAADLAGDDFIGDVGANIASVVAVADWLDGGDAGDIEVVATGSTTSRSLADRFAQVYYVEDYGAVGDGSTDDRAAIQAAIDAATAAGGGTVWLTRGKTYRASNSGNSLGSLNYAIALQPNVYLDGGGTIARHGTSMAFVLISGFGSGTFPAITQSMGLRNITVDGRASTRVDGDAGTGGNGDGFNVWLFNVLNPVCENVRSIDAASWGIRIERCKDGAFINHITADHGADVNADGVHFVDCQNLTANGFQLYSEGDDAFIVEANSYDVFGNNFTGISIQNPSSGVTSARRAILVLRDTSLSTTTRNFYDNLIEGVVHNADDAALYIKATALNVYGNRFQVVSHSAESGLYIQVGDALATGTVHSNLFDIVTTDSLRRGINMLTSGLGGTIDMNRLNAIVRNPGDGFSGAFMLGTRWQGWLIVDYDPGASKASPLPAIYCDTLQYSDLQVTVNGGSYCLRLEGSSDDNTFRVGLLSDGVTGDVLIDSGSTGNTFIGGQISGTITNNSDTTNQFVAVNGVSDSLVTPDPIAWTPTISASSGTITTSSTTHAVYRVVDRIVFFSVSITVTDNGTGSGFLRFTPPTGTPQYGGNFTARNSTSGAGLIATVATAGTQVLISTTASAYPVASGQTVVCQGFYFLT